MDFKHLIFNEPDAPAKPSPAPAPHTNGAIPVTPAWTPVFNADKVVPPTVDTVDAPNAFLDRLRAKTDFDGSDVGKQLQEHMEPLAGLPLTEAQQMTAALKAGVKDGLTAEKIQTTLQGLLAALDQDKAAFQTALAAATAKEVDARKAAIDEEVKHAKDLEDQITASRQKQSDLSTQLIQAQGAIQTKSSQYDVAYQTRRGELQGKLDHFSQILQGA